MKHQAISTLLVMRCESAQESELGADDSARLEAREVYAMATAALGALGVSITREVFPR